MWFVLCIEDKFACKTQLARWLGYVQWIGNPHIQEGSCLNFEVGTGSSCGKWDKQKFSSKAFSGCLSLDL